MPEVPAEVLARPALLMPTSGSAGMVAAPVPTEVLDVMKVESGTHEATAAVLQLIYFQILPLNHWLKKNLLLKKTDRAKPHLPGPSQFHKF